MLDLGGRQVNWSLCRPCAARSNTLSNATRTSGEMECKKDAGAADSVFCIARCSVVESTEDPWLPAMLSLPSVLYELRFPCVVCGEEV